MKDEDKTREQLMDELDAMRERVQFLENILESSSAISIVSTDLDRNILYWNVGAENIFGYKAEEVVGRHKIDILYPNDGDTRRRVEEVRAFVFENGKGTTCGIEEITRDGRRLCVNLTLTPRLDAHGQPIGILGIGQDITERRNAEQEREILQKQLEDALARILRGFLPICASCKKIRDDEGYWHPVEVYVREHTEAQFSHGICPECARELYGEFVNKT
jgi:PAS domain S-box-containing protein